MSRYIPTSNETHIFSEVIIESAMSADTGWYSCLASDGSDDDYCRYVLHPCISTITTSNHAWIQVIGMFTVILKAVIGEKVECLGVVIGLLPCLKLLVLRLIYLYPKVHHSKRKLDKRFHSTVVGLGVTDISYNRHSNNNNFYFLLELVMISYFYHIV